MTRLWICLLAVALSGCRGAECEGPGDCPDGFVCTESATCQQIACTSSLDCPIESWCDGGVAQCISGCLNDRDCLPGSVCDQDQKECVARGCRSTVLDCAFGEFCNPVSGACVPAGGYYCQPCETNEQCGSAANFCIRMGGGLQQTPYCAVDCSVGQGCPNGYSCSAIVGAGGVELGYGCTAPCWEAP